MSSINEGLNNACTQIKRAISYTYHDILIDQTLNTRFSPKLSAENPVWRITVIASTILLLMAGGISYLAFPQLTFVAFIIGVSLKDPVRHLVKSHVQMWWTVTNICKLALVFFAVPSITYLSLIFPFFLGSFMAFHALDNPDGKESYFTADFPKTEIQELTQQVSQLTEIVRNLTPSVNEPHFEDETV